MLLIDVIRRSNANNTSQTSFVAESPSFAHALPSHFHHVASNTSNGRGGGGGGKGRGRGSGKP